MVGVPRSKGCLLCVQRRVKCDQAKPQCGNCTRYGAGCPGYDRSLKFVSGKHAVKSRARPAGDDGPAIASSGGASTGTHDDETQPLDDNPPASSASASNAVGFPIGAPPPGILLTPAVARAQYICTMLSSMYTILTPVEGWFLNSWFSGIEPRLGSQAALDSATMSLVLHVLGKANKDDGMVGESRSLYGKSLHALQGALNHKSEWRTTETLCATTLLCYFELFAGTKDSGSWMKHASGVGWLIQQRGPSAYMTEWEKAILKGFRPLITLDALFAAKECFLARPQWQALLRRLSLEDGTESWECQRRAVTDRYFMILAKVPTVFRHIIPLHQALVVGIKPPIDIEAFAPLMRYAELILQELKLWARDLYTHFTPPVEKPSRDPESPFQTVFRFDNVWEGSLYMGYWATRVVVQYSLQLAKGRKDLIESNRELCSNIYRSLETVGAGLMGPYRVGYSLRIAYEPAEPHIQRWIKGLLERYGEIYAGLDETSFRDPEEQVWNFGGFVDETIPPGLQ